MSVCSIWIYAGATILLQVEANDMELDAAWFE